MSVTITVALFAGGTSVLKYGADSVSIILCSLPAVLLNQFNEASITNFGAALGTSTSITSSQDHTKRLSVIM